MGSGPPLISALIYCVRADIDNFPANDRVVLTQRLNGALRSHSRILDYFEINRCKAILLNVEPHILTTYGLRARHRQKPCSDDCEYQKTG